MNDKVPAVELIVPKWFGLYIPWTTFYFICCTRQRLYKCVWKKCTCKWNTLENFLYAINLHGTFLTAWGGRKHYLLSCLLWRVSPSIIKLCFFLLLFLLCFLIIYIVLFTFLDGTFFIPFGLVLRVPTYKVHGGFKLSHQLASYKLNEIQI